MKHQGKSSSDCRDGSIVGDSAVGVIGDYDQARKMMVTTIVIVCMNSSVLILKLKINSILM